MPQPWSGQTNNGAAGGTRLLKRAAGRADGGGAGKFMARDLQTHACSTLLETGVQNFQISIRRLPKNLAMVLRIWAQTLAYRAMIHLPPHELHRLNSQLTARRRK